MFQGELGCVARIDGGPFGDASHARANVLNVPLGHEPQPALNLLLNKIKGDFPPPATTGSEIAGAVLRGNDRFRIALGPFLEKHRSQFI